MDKVENPKRLCSEIQLFDICEKSSCKYKDGRFCTDGDILARFEAISEEDTADDLYLADEMEEMDEDELSYDEGVSVDEDEEPEDEDY